MSDSKPPEPLSEVMHIRLTKSQHDYLHEKNDARQVAWYVRKLIDADRNGKRRRR
jgi:hypothetical protein